jgi:hypothetical protein
MGKLEFTVIFPAESEDTDVNPLPEILYEQLVPEIVSYNFIYVFPFVDAVAAVIYVEFPIVNLDPLPSNLYNDVEEGEAI